jgi:hypothetical protein
MTEPEPHICQMVAALQENQVRPLLAAAIARLLMLDGPAITQQMLPPLEKVWVEPFGTNWRPYEN